MRKKVLSLIMGHNNLCGKNFRTIYVVRENFPHKKFVRKKLFLTCMGVNKNVFWTNTHLERVATLFIIAMFYHRYRLSRSFVQQR